MKNLLLCFLLVACHKNVQEKIINSSVSIEVYEETGWSAFGSGVVIESAEEQMVLTAQHITEQLEGRSSRVCNHLGCSNIEICAIQTNDYVNNRIDWNVCLIENPVFDSVRIKQHSLYIGEPVLQAGYPNGSFWFSQGVVSTIEPQLGIQGFGWPGSSGSGIWTQSGQLIGIVSWIPIYSGPLGMPVFSSNQVYATSINEIINAQ